MMMKKLKYFTVFAILALFSLFYPCRSEAATITVDSLEQEDPLVNDGDCTLSEAIKAANDDAAVDGCTAGNGADVIELEDSAVYNLTNDFEFTCGLTKVTSTITVNGNGSMVIRDFGSPEEFRILAVDSSGDLTINNLIIAGAVHSTAVGALFNQGRLTLNSCVVTGNTMEDAAAIYNADTGTLIINRSSIKSNTAADLVGGIFNNGGYVTIKDSSITSNIGGGGAGIRINYSFTAPDAKTLIYNTTIRDNSAGTNSGGGLAVHSDATVEIFNSTISENMANLGAGIFVYSDGIAKIKNTILSDNVLPDGVTPRDCQGVVTSEGYNIVKSTSNCTITATTGDRFDIDPGLEAYADDGVPGNGHYAPADDSEAIDSGDPSVCIAPNLDHDQLLNVRDVSCDIGSIEAVCGDNILHADSLGEECDDGNASDGDGCSSDCRDEVCGDGKIVGIEECDDDNTDDSDGCSSACAIEAGYACAGEPSACTEGCGNGVKFGSEECDDGNLTDGDGCSSVCKDEFCGDDVINNNGSEECDGDDLDGDTCQTLGFDTGVLVCDDSCAVDDSGCVANGADTKTEETTSDPGKGDTTDDSSQSAGTTGATPSGGCSLIR